jgi:hypothetical protein
MVSQAASQAPSLPGPLTSGLSTSRIMRAVRTQSTRSDSVAQRHRAGCGSRLADSISSDTSSGVVDSPYGQQQPGERCHENGCGMLRLLRVGVVCVSPCQFS